MTQRVFDKKQRVAQKLRVKLHKARLTVAIVAENVPGMFRDLVFAYKTDSRRDGFEVFEDKFCLRLLKGLDVYVVNEAEKSSYDIIIDSVKRSVSDIETELIALESRKVVPVVDHSVVSQDRHALVEAVLDALTKLQAAYPDQEVSLVYGPAPSREERFRLGDMVIFEGVSSEGYTLAFDQLI